MLNEKRLKQLRELLENAQNPVFFFDNDLDGLTSFLILQRSIGRGRGVAIRGTSTLEASFFKKVEELNGDYVFLLDRSKIDDDFIKLAEEKNIQIVCVDHHEVEKPKIKNYFNVILETGKEVPTSYICYKVFERKEDLWLAVIGSIADCHIPDFIDDFKKEYPELLNKKYKTAYDIRYNCEIGKIMKVMGYGLFDKTSNVVQMLKYLMKAKGPYDVLEENSRTRSFLQKYEQINSRVNEVVRKAKEQIDKKHKFLFFRYGGETSVSQYVSDELNYRYPDYFIVVGFLKGDFAKFSLRGPIDVRKITLESIKDIEGSSGGGHKHSCGVQIMEKDVPQFKENLIKNLEKLEK